MSWMETPEARASNDDERRNLIAGARHSQSVSHLPRAFARVIQYPLHPRPFSPEYRRGEGRNVNLIVSWEEPLGTEALVSRRVSNQPARSQRWPICWAVSISLAHLFAVCWTTYARVGEPGFGAVHAVLVEKSVQPRVRNCLSAHGFLLPQPE